MMGNDHGFFFFFFFRKKKEKPQFPSRVAESRIRILSLVSRLVESVCSGITTRGKKGLDILMQIVTYNREKYIHKDIL